MTRITIAAVSYLNTIPFLYGIADAQNNNVLCADLLLSPPAGCAEAFRRSQADIALIPVAEIPSCKNARIIGRHCIGAVGDVRTVVVVSSCPIEQVKSIYLDDHSLTSAALVRVLAREHWHIEPQWLPLSDYSTVGADPDAGYLLIGDKVFGHEGKLKYSYDLAHQWRDMTGLPFVFAAWIAREGVSQEIVDVLEAALDYGTSHIENAMARDGRIDYATGVDYLKHNIDFRLDAPKREALELFWKKHREGGPKINPG